MSPSPHPAPQTQALPDDPLAVLAIARGTHNNDTLAACHRQLRRIWPDWAAGSVGAFASKLRRSRQATEGRASPLRLEPITGPDAMREGEAYLCATFGETTGVYRIQNGPPAFVYGWAKPRPIMPEYAHFLKITKATE